MADSRNDASGEGGSHDGHVESAGATTKVAKTMVVEVMNRMLPVR